MKQPFSSMPAVSAEDQVCRSAGKEAVRKFEGSTESITAPPPSILKPVGTKTDTDESDATPLLLATMGSVRFPPRKRRAGREQTSFANSLSVLRSKASL